MKILGLAPMDGFTDFACREITKDIRNKYGDKTKYDFFLRTEFMNADGYIINPQGVIRHLLTNKGQTPVIAQIFGGNEDKLLECFIDIEKKYSDLFYGLELNLGCPARTVVQNGGGSAMLQDKKRTLYIIKKIRQSIKMPFSIKTRTGINEDDLQNQKDFLIEASQYLDMISIHGRTVKQGYGGDINRDFIYDIKKNANPNCKIIGNGAIKSYEELNRHCEEGNDEAILDGIMIGQGAIGNPRIFTEHEKSKTELYETISRHLELMLSSEYFFETTTKNSMNINYDFSKKDLDKPLSTEVILVQFRKHLFQYIKGLTGSKEFKVEISQIKGYENFINKMKSFFS